MLTLTWLKKNWLLSRDNSISTEPVNFKKNTISNDWKLWIVENINRGCSKDELFKILHDNGFNYKVIKREMNYFPTLPLYQIDNPLNRVISHDTFQSNSLTEKLSSGIPKFTSEGFEVREVPKQTWNLIKEVYELLKLKQTKESYKGIEAQIKTNEPHNAADILSLDQLPTIKQLVHEQLQPLHEEWCGCSLEPSFIYGIRSYKKGATLYAHVDRIETHHIGCIILVDEKVNKPWPLDIQDNHSIWKKVYIKPGQMILYESATCIHGRLEPFDGEYFRNLFIHYKLLWYKSNND